MSYFQGTENNVNHFCLPVKKASSVLYIYGGMKYADMKICQEHEKEKLINVGKSLDGRWSWGSCCRCATL